VETKLVDQQHKFVLFNRKNRNTSTLLNHFDTTFHSARKFASDVGASQQQRREEVELGRSLFLLLLSPKAAVTAAAAAMLGVVENQAAPGRYM